MGGVPDFTNQLTVTSNLIGTVSIGVPSRVVCGAKVVTTAGTRVPLLALSTACLAVAVKALDSNAGKVYVGGSDVSSANGYVLLACDEIAIDINDVAYVWIDASVNGEGVRFLYLVE